MTELDVDGATLYYESIGTGPALILVPGGSGDAGPFGPMARIMSAHYRVISYDRRGFSRSAVPLPAAGLDRVACDVADLAALIDLAGGPAYVFGSSSGAIVSLALLVAHPDRVRAVVAHEPPAFALLDEGPRIQAEFDEVLQVYAVRGVTAALARFNRIAGLSDGDLPADVGLPPAVRAMIERMRANQPFFLERELKQYTSRPVDVAGLRPYTSKLVLANGADSGGALPYQPNLVLGRRLGLPIAHLAGGHIGYVTDPGDFAAQLSKVLATR